ncbi:PREDICTED: interleukin-1 receptor-like 1 [Elephantulus edwardii]|uniref:interleukin-1 receptor-like 1 n=1 Tax=Elephantulus edwardii TaxID=28737 RepID=UPI0003F0CB04|nr:PREDICTED: interleukin-1 receptor-like 1 [Elephantulus edwardii]
MGIWVLTILTLLDSTAAQIIKPYWGLENEALIVPCPYTPKSLLISVDWYYANKSIIIQKRDRVFASGKFLKFLPTKIDDSGIYTCIYTSATYNFTRIVNLTIAKQQPDCKIPDYLMYSTVSGNEKFTRIYCPTTELYNWTEPLEWFKDCKALQEPKYDISESALIIQEATSDDSGDYTCKLTHNENGVNYTVTATRTLQVESKLNFLMNPVVKAPLHNDTVEVEIGKTANITCLGCVGENPGFIDPVNWRVNKTKVSDLDEARFHEEKVESESSTDGLNCLKRILRIKDVKETDLSQEYSCLAYNLRAVAIHTIRLRRKNPIDYQSTHYTVAGFSVLLMLVGILAMLLKIFWIDFILLWRDVIGPYKTGNDGKIYDAYVIYPRNYKKSPEGTSSVEYFVHQILPDVLENKCGYNLCIYGRDMVPGEDAATAVETNIQKSRRHIFILTPQIVHSQEFAYEQEVALHCALIQNNSKVILIEMQALCEQDGLQCEEFQESLKHLMRVQGTIKWKEDHMMDKWSLKSKFWKHVRYQMPVPNKLPKKTLNLVSLNIQGQ